MDERGDALATRHQGVLRDLAQPGAVLPRWQRGERAHVGVDRERLMERADQVLALGEVDRGLAADGGVDLGEQRGRGLHDRDAAVVHGGGEAGGVAHHTATERDHRVVAQEPPGGETRAQVVDGGERLGVLALAHQEQVGRDPRPLEGGGQRGRVEVGDTGLAHDRDPAAPGEQRARPGERTVADDDVVGRVERDRHPFHAWYSSHDRVGDLVDAASLGVDLHIGGGLVRRLALRAEPRQGAAGRRPREQRDGRRRCRPARRGPRATRATRRRGRRRAGGGGSRDRAPRRHRTR